MGSVIYEGKCLSYRDRVRLTSEGSNDTCSRSGHYDPTIGSMQMNDIQCTTEVFVHTCRDCEGGRGGVEVPMLG